MVKSRRKSNLRRRPFLAVIIILFIALAGLSAAKMITYFSVQNSPDPETTAEPTSVDKDTKKTETIYEENVDEKEIIQNEGEDPNTLENLTGSITTARVSGSKVIIRVNLDQYLPSGVCSLVMVNGDKTYSDTANITDSASTSTCEGFDIPTSELSSGTWLISIEFSSGEKTGNVSGEVSL